MNQQNNSNSQKRNWFGLVAFLCLGLLAGCSASNTDKLLAFKQINLVSSVDGVAPNTDATLLDAWGLEFGDPDRVWVNGNAGYSIVYDGKGNVAQVKDPQHPGKMVDMRVKLPIDPTAVPLGAPATYTGMIFVHNPGDGKSYRKSVGNAPFQGDVFIFVSEQGVIAGWQPLPNGTEPLEAVTRVDNNAAGAVYKGATDLKTPSGWRLYVANFGQGEVDVFDTSYKPMTVSGGFHDPTLPFGYAPFNIKAMNGQIYVTYAKLSIDKANDVKGLGNGFVDVFDADGKLIKGLVSGGKLNSPWGLAIAPANYGKLSNKLLVGNFGDGHINVYDPKSGHYQGTVADNGEVLQIDDLWALTFGSGNGAGDTNQLFFTAGSSAESQGIFGKLLQIGVNVAASDTLTVYSGQHEQTINAMVAGFEKESGIQVSVRSDDEGVLASQIVQEGTKSPADVFVTENSPALAFLANQKLLAPVDAKTLALVPAADSSAQKAWVGVSARVSALVYNNQKITDKQLPTSVLALADPIWKGRLAFAPSETDFQPLVTALLKLVGKDKTIQWLQGLKANGEIYPDNESVTAAVNSGTSEVGLINHYYWYRLRDEVGVSKTHSALHYFAPGDVGNLINVSGAAVLKSSPHSASAQKFLAYLVSKAGETILANGESYEYPLGSGVTASADLPPFAGLQPPPVSLEDLGDGSTALDLLKQVGLL